MLRRFIIWTFNLSADKSQSVWIPECLHCTIYFVAFYIVLYLSNLDFISEFPLKPLVTERVNELS